MALHKLSDSSTGKPDETGALNTVWSEICTEASALQMREPLLAEMLRRRILSQPSLEDALAYQVAQSLADAYIKADCLRKILTHVLAADPAIGGAARADLVAVRTRDPACTEYLVPFLHFKGFLALQIYRVAHWLWEHSSRHVALYLQSRTAAVLAVDIHPAARIGCGILVDHATGIVIGETAVVEDDVSILQGVTLGGTGKERGDRHPKIRRGVVIGAGATILGNIEIGRGARIGAGSVVLKDVPPHATAVGIPATVVGIPANFMGIPAAVADPALRPMESIERRAAPR